MRLARELIAREQLGKIYFAEAVWGRSRGIPFGIGGWVHRKKRSSGGALIDIAIHALDSAWVLMGTPRPISVSQNFRHLATARVFDVEDTAFWKHRTGGANRQGLEKIVIPSRPPEPLIANRDC